MSNSQRPNHDSPWASQDPNWHPTDFRDAQGRDPRAPFGQASSAPPPYNDLEPPKRPTSSLLIVLGAVGLVGAIILGMQFIGAGDSSPSPTPTAPATTSAEPTPERTGNWIPFEGNGSGTFEILSYEWTEDTLTAKIRVDVSEGEFGFSVFAFADKTRTSYDPDDVSGFTVRTGTPYVGEVVFHMPKADSTLVLATPSGRIALNALPVKG